MSIVNDILDLSKIEAGALELEEVDVETIKLVSEVENSVRLSAEDKGLEFKVIYEKPVIRTIRSDYTRGKAGVT